MESKKSYLEMENEIKPWMNSINPENLSITQVMPTIERMYRNGANDMDNKWRHAIETYCNENNIKFNDIFLPLLGILNR